MSGSNCCFLTRTEVSQVTGKVVWYFHLFRNISQFVMIHTVKGLSAVKETDVFLQLPCFVQNLTNICNLISVSSASLKPRLYILEIVALCTAEA